MVKKRTRGWRIQAAGRGTISIRGQGGLSGPERRTDSQTQSWERVVDLSAQTLPEPDSGHGGIQVESRPSLPQSRGSGLAGKGIVTNETKGCVINENSPPPFFYVITKILPAKVDFDGEST